MLAPRRLVVPLATALALVTGCTSSGGDGNDDDSGAQGSSGGGSSSLSEGVSGKKVSFIIYAPPATPFFEPVVAGAKDAAAAYGVDLDIQYSNSDVATQNNQINTALAADVDALALSVASDDAFTDSVCAAQEQGVPVVAFNVTASTGPVLDCLLSFVGQDFEQAGALIAQRMIDDDLIRSGDEVACPVEDPSAVYAIQRAAGVNSALEAVGAECDVVATGFDLAEAQTALQQYLLGRSNTQAIVALGLVPLQVAPAAAQAAGVDVEIGGFDLSSEISEAIESGDITAAVNQQPYLQGYYAVTQLALRLKYGLTPSDIDTGNALVDSTNVAEVSELAGSVY